MQCPSFTLQVVLKFRRGGKTMNDTSTSSFFVVLLFILRCLVPLAILFGISYLLRRMGLIAIETPEPNEKSEEKSTGDSGSTTASPKITSVTRPKKSNNKKSSKRKTGPPKKKTTGKTRTGNSSKRRAGPLKKKTTGKTRTGNSRSRSK